MKNLYTKNTRKYKQLQPEERGQIEAYYNINMSISATARRINRSKSTISYEIRRSKYLLISSFIRPVAKLQKNY